MSHGKTGWAAPKAKKRGPFGPLSALPAPVWIRPVQDVQDEAGPEDRGACEDQSHGSHGTFTSLCGRRLYGYSLRALRMVADTTAPFVGGWGAGVGCRPPVGLGYASALGAKRTRARSATSGAMPQVVFLASAARVCSLRSHPRRRFGSMPSSSASALGVIVVASDMMNPFRVEPAPCARWAFCSSATSYHGVCKGRVRVLYGDCKRCPSHIPHNPHTNPSQIPHNSLTSDPYKSIMDPTQNPNRSTPPTTPQGWNRVQPTGRPRPKVPDRLEFGARQAT